MNKNHKNQSVIHPTAIIGEEVEIAADGVNIGPQCCLLGKITIGAGTRLFGHNYLTGPLVLGTGNRVYPFTCIGYEPQDFKFDTAKPCAGVVIGDNNIIREQVTIHRSTSEIEPTRIGNNCMLMVGVHIGHDCSLGSGCVMVNNSSLGGHTQLGDNVTLGGNSAIAQKIRIGRLSFIGGGVGICQHVPPFMLARFTRMINSLNLVGLRRSGMSRTEIDNLRWAFRVIFKEDNTNPAAIAKLNQRAGESPAIAEIVQFMVECGGNICGGE